MNLLLEIYNNLLLTESPFNVNDITSVIKNRREVTINYEGDPKHGIAPGIRTVQIYTYGLTKAGNPVVRAYQPYGDTASSIPDWKLFRLDRITQWKPTLAVFNRPAPKFNPNGDGSMSSIFDMVNFNNPPEGSELSGPKQKYKEIGKLDNIDQILKDREKEKNRGKEQNKIINSPKTPETPVVVKPELPKEPEIKGIPNKTKEPELYKTQGDEELQRIKDLNKRMDNLKTIDLTKIPKR